MQIHSKELKWQKRTYSFSAFRRRPYRTTHAAAPFLAFYTCWVLKCSVSYSIAACSKLRKQQWWNDIQLANSITKKKTIHNNQERYRVIWSLELWKKSRQIKNHTNRLRYPKLWGTCSWMGYPELETLGLVYLGIKVFGVRLHLFMLKVCLRAFSGHTNTQADRCQN